MSEPIGWNVYSVVGESSRFFEFIPNDEALDPFASAFADHVEVFVASKVLCGAVLFPLPPRVPDPGFPVHPCDVAYFAPRQGPSPVACAREPHEGSPWHWHCGTWWR